VSEISFDEDVSMEISVLLRGKPVGMTLVAALLVSGLFGAEHLWSGQSRFLSPDFKLPTGLANSKEWKTMLESPKPVPLALWLQCIAPTPADWSKAKEKYGPHSAHYIQVYANQIANHTLLGGKRGTFPTGAVIAKEKLMDSSTGTVVGVAFMIKRSEPKFASTGGWEFSYYPRSDDTASMQECGNCHRAVASRDYVFGPYPSSADALR
jgi:Cytochrome P460